MIIEPQSPVIHLYLGQSYKAKGLLAKARSEYQRARELNPGLFLAKDNLKRLKRQRTATAFGKEEKEWK